MSDATSSAGPTWKLGALAALALFGAACSPLVGQDCEQGFHACSGACVALDRDPGNCGGCGVVCASGVCSAGRCVDEDGGWAVGDASLADAEGGPGDAGIAAGDAGDAGEASHDADGSADAAPFVDDAWSDSAATDAATVDQDAATVDQDAATTDQDAATTDQDAATADQDAGPPLAGCDVGELACGAACVRALSDPSNCGDCGVACAIGQACSVGLCTLVCGAGETACGRSCVDTASDALNCGGCGVVCETGICSDSTCVAARAGHVVVIGHDYAVSRSPMDSLLANAVALSGRSTTRVLHYAGASRAASVAGVVSALARASIRPTTTMLASSPADVPLGLASSDVLLVYAQHDATDDVLVDLGTTWARALTTFLARGGVIVALDAMSAANTNGAAEWLGAAGLATSVSRQDCSGSIARVLVASDGLAVGLPLSYRAEMASVRWIGPDATPIVASGSGAIAMHRTFVP